MFEEEKHSYGCKKEKHGLAVCSARARPGFCPGLVCEPPAAAGSKTVTVEVVHGDGTEKTFLIRTDAETLRRACEEQNLIAGTEGEYGLYVLTVDGETADESIQQWWCITKGGEEHFYGVDDTMIQDGEQYEFTLKTGW